MGSRQWKDYTAIIAGVALTRVLFRSRYLYDLDSINFALALEEFDPALLQPHPPGYYLYVVAGRWLDSIFRDPNSSLVAMSIVASCGMAAAIYALAERWHGIGAARCSAFLFVVSPLCWFHGTVALTYVVEGFFSALLGCLCWDVYARRRTSLVPSAIVLGLAIGFRQSSILFLGPLWLLTSPKVSRRQICLGIGAFCATTLCWFVPMVVEAGGPMEYFTALDNLWSRVPAQRTVFSYPFWDGVGLGLSRAFLLVFILVLCFGPFLCMPLLTRSTKRRREGMRRFVGAWMIPGCVFFSLVYLIFVNSGYLLILCPPVFAWIGSCVAEWLNGFESERRLKAGIMSALAAANICLFLWAPLYCSYQSVKAFEANLLALRQSVRERFSPKETVLVSFDSHFQGFRHVGYYLPEFLTLVYPAARFREENQVLSMEGGRTRLNPDLGTSRKNFVIVPLPEGPRYDSYLNGVLARFPVGVLQKVNGGKRRFHLGMLGELRHLFPAEVVTPDIAYTPVDSSL